MIHCSRTFAFLLWMLLVPLVQAQERALAPDLGGIADAARWRVYNAVPEALAADGRRGARLSGTSDSALGKVGLALVEGLAFETGTIEVELKGRNVRGRSFLGVAFNVAGENRFEAVYFRPFNFRADDVFRRRAVQYIAWPDFTWERLRRERPDTFEGPIDPVPDPDGWFHARVDVTATQVRVFVDAAATPTLVVERLPTGARGRQVGLFVDASDGTFANFRVTPGP
ncbi:MAG: hypothetical protein U1F58_13170 [Burkholderiales bacterium]